VRNREPKKTFREMMVAIGDCLSNIASSNNGEDGEDENDEVTEQGQLNEDDKPCWGMGTSNKTVQQRMERFRQKQMKLDELTQPGYEDTAHYFPEKYKKYGTSESSIPAVIQLQTDDDAAAPAPTTFGEPMESLGIVPGILQMPQGTSRPGSSHMRLYCGKPQSKTRIPGLEPAMEPDSSVI